MADALKDIRKEIILQSIARNFEYSEAIIKWCYTTLTALNGGALLAIVGLEDLRRNAIADIGLWFGAGILCSILASFIASYGYSQLANSTAKLLWQGDVLEEDSYDIAAVQEIKGGGTFFLGLLAAIGSAVLLVIGAIEVSKSVSAV